MFLFLVHMPKAIYITGNLLYCIQQLKTLQISTLRGKAKNYSENILLCEYTMCSHYGPLGLASDFSAKKVWF